MGRLMLVLGVLCLVPAVLGSLLVPVHFLPGEAAQVAAREEPSEVREKVYVGSNKFVKREISLTAPRAMLYRLKVLPKKFIPARFILRGGVDMAKNVELHPDFRARFDGLWMKVRINGEERYSTSFDIDDQHFRTFHVKLPPSGDLVIAIEFDPGPLENNDYDRAIIKDLRIEPSFTGVYILAGVLLLAGAGLVRYGRGQALNEEEDNNNSGIKTKALSTWRKLGFSLLVFLVLGTVVAESAFIKFARTSALVHRHPWIMPPGLTRYEPNKVWRFDPETGLSIKPDLNIEYEFLDGDIFYFNKTALRRHEPVAVTHRTDRYGFRNDAPPESARIAVVGDSFVAGLNVNHPFPGRLADLLGVSVYNLGTERYGTLQEEISLGRMLGRLPALEVVVLAWFSGNDLKDNQKFIEARDANELADEYDDLVYDMIMGPAPESYFPLERSLSGRALFRFVPGMKKFSESFEIITLKTLHQQPAKKTGRPGAPPAPNQPVEKSTPEKPDDQLNTFALKLKGVDTSLAMLLPLRETLTDEDMDQGLAAIGRISEMLAAKNAQLFVLYIPVSFEAYREMLSVSYTDAELGRKIMPIAKGWQAATPEELMAKIDDDITFQAERLSRYCASRNIAFLDLTPGFRKKAPLELLYYENDTHFNQAGHDLAAALIAGEISRIWPGRFPGPKQ